MKERQVIVLYTSMLNILTVSALLFCDIVLHEEPYFWPIIFIYTAHLELCMKHMNTEIIKQEKLKRRN